jgi:hypothetical protein
MRFFLYFLLPPAVFALVWVVRRLLDSFAAPRELARLREEVTLLQAALEDHEARSWRPSRPLPSGREARLSRGASSPPSASSPASSEKTPLQRGERPWREGALFGANAGGAPPGADPNEGFSEGSSSSSDDAPVSGDEHWDAEHEGGDCPAESMEVDSPNRFSSDRRRLLVERERARLGAKHAAFRSRCAEQDMLGNADMGAGLGPSSRNRDGPVRLRLTTTAAQRRGLTETWG